MEIAKIGVFIDEAEAKEKWSKGLNSFELYILEIFEHLRLPYQIVSDLTEMNQFDIVVIALLNENSNSISKIVDFAESGGVVISYGGLNLLADWFGYRKGNEMETGYAFLHQELNQENPLRFLRAEPWVEVKSTYNVTEKGWLSRTNKGKSELNISALQQFSVGKGNIDRWAIPIPELIVGFQQGKEPVTKDGLPAPDGSANLDEGILKADDGFELDWDLDREYTNTGIPYFSIPYADLWREVILEHLFTRVIEKQLTLPFIHYWPGHVKHMAMISHDSDLNEDASAITTLNVLKQNGIQSTWCMIMPGYDPSIYEQLKRDGHELAFHYNALETEDGIWGEDEFGRQLNILKEASNTDEIISNKNHYTRFEGWGEFFTWCEKHGIEVDQSRGPSKKGNIGFLFGTCHPFFPVASADDENRFYNVLEIGFLTQDLNHHALADISVIDPFLKMVKRVDGVAHFLFHQYHIHNQNAVYKAINDVIKEAKKQGFSFWTSRGINNWERQRRNISIVGIDDNYNVVTECDENYNDVVIYIPISNANCKSEKVVERFGVQCVEKLVSRQSLNIIGKELE
ncbi:hypothetical protein [Bacillus sp. REN16]|uniref:hypothetical protein n=1 Tax=Bacillus sp. REN16 TaxID=2887296 RepID=UPI001E48FE26|nr:hypothetical protein [Bacillus sp. REN16]MCC3357169.1 hypothetical protein [Bacillus sp. REN16]